MPNLFQGEFIFLHSGEATDFKIDCDALTDEDLASIAKVISRNIKFSKVYPIPTGGERLAKALEKYGDPKYSAVLIADDVLSTGRSFKHFKFKLEKELNTLRVQSPYRPSGCPEIKGICIFCRRPEMKPDWVEAVFTMSINNIEPTNELTDEQQLVTLIEKSGIDLSFSFTEPEPLSEMEAKFFILGLCWHLTFKQPAEDRCAGLLEEIKTNQDFLQLVRKTYKDLQLAMGPHLRELFAKEYPTIVSDE